MPDMPEIVDSSTISETAPEDDSALIHLNKISVMGGGEYILKEVDLSVSRNEIVTMVGPNGAGKSTLVKIALGLIKPDQGTVISCHGLKTGYVPQSVNLDESLPISVKRFLEVSGTKNTEKLTAALHHVGAGNLLGHSLRNVSGGELRRILLARALLMKPDLMILDEPTSGVDIGGQASLYSLIQWIRDTYHCGILLVSHNLHVVMAATDRVVCLNRHLCCSGTPEHVQQHPEFVSLFGNKVAGELGFYRHDHDHEHDLHGDVHNGHQVSDKSTVKVPEHG
jgi:zinc transport system ATP-binding protein